MLRFLTAGESHGRALVVIVDGLPAGLTLDPGTVARDLRRRQGGYGRGRRMAIESDTAVVMAGVRHGRTTGAPVAHDHRQPRLGELAVHDARGGGPASPTPPGRGARR